MAKQLSTGAKVAIWIGVLATVGVSGWAFHQYIYKPWKAKRNSNSDTGDNVILPNDSLITPTDTSTSTDQKIKSFEEVKKSLGSNAKIFDNYVTITGTPDMVGLKTKIDGSVMAKFQKDSGYRLYHIPNGSNKATLLHGGLYWDGGKTLKVFNDIINNGANKGLTVTSSTPFGALIKASKP